MIHKLYQTYRIEKIKNTYLDTSWIHMCPFFFPLSQKKAKYFSFRHLRFYFAIILLAQLSLNIAKLFIFFYINMLSNELENKYHTNTNKLKKEKIIFFFN